MSSETDKARAVIAPAKINLYLHVTGRRADGYHLLDSLVAFAGINDVLSVRPAAELTLELTGPFAEDIPAAGDNLVLMAARALREQAGINDGAALKLTKRLPVAGGIGGGSADAAATLRALNGLWGLGLADTELLALGLKLGADVPVCLRGRAAFMGGIGENLVPAPVLPRAWVVLVNPGRALSTPAVFEMRRQMMGDDFSAPAGFNYAPQDAAELAAVLAKRRNDLEAAAVALVPAVGEVLAALNETAGSLLARMSGSGATCFGIMATAEAAATAALALAGGHPDWWVKAASLKGDTVRAAN
ncbi:MAG TPA: 4-(cytidine 5'-diphospho)-2-C-methyl-D-erythritol kinase [Alphaproteobacteria bacterium]|nr:4-(cytidine 5'-diphospho)-2-C-methyl-D-erythritol kinase [Alphaproteobacteria bacterium]